jgi:hypothetical protein
VAPLIAASRQLNLMGDDSPQVAREYPKLNWRASILLRLGLAWTGDGANLLQETKGIHHHPLFSDLGIQKPEDV